MAAASLSVLMTGQQVVPPSLHLLGGAPVRQARAPSTIHTDSESESESINQAIHSRDYELSLCLVEVEAAIVESLNNHVLLRRPPEDTRRYYPHAPETFSWL